MPVLLLRNRPIDSVFELIGRNENSLTFALGWCMREAPALSTTIAQALNTEVPVEDKTTVLLQQHGGKYGFTDVEVRDLGNLFWIFEAKVGFLPPVEAQLTKYAERLNRRDDRNARPLLVVVAQSDRRDHVLKRNVPEAIEEVPVAVLSWGQLIRCCRLAYPASSNSGKSMLRQLEAFVKKVLVMRDQGSNPVFVVSISQAFWTPVGTTLRAVVTEHARYFHPAGAGWPKVPPNYLAFRWDGRLQSIHHVEAYKVVESMEGEFPAATDEAIDPHFLYVLGPAIRPTKEVRNGPRIVQANRVKVALDLLLTSETISEALDLTNARQEEAIT